MKELDEELRRYGAGDFYPFHMPGHKRRFLALGEPSRIDITEIGGFDDLHHPEGILRELENEAASLFRVKKSFCLVNGSTVGILAGIFSAVSREERVLAAENCHKSVFHAIALRGLEAAYLKPSKTRFGMEGLISPEELERGFLTHPGTKAVIVTSPTYEGIVSNIGVLAEITHKHGAILIVDEAHGAHLSFSGGFPKSAAGLGADLVATSLHKTLPSLTQTALLQLCSDRVSEMEIYRMLDFFETSSPSYVLLSSMAQCFRILREDGKELFEEYEENLRKWYQSTGDLENIRVLRREELTKEEAFDKDPGKLLIRSMIPGISGEALLIQLRDVYHLELERSRGNYCIAMTSICDEEAGFRRLTEALHEMDRNPEMISPVEDSREIREYEIYRGFSL